VGWRTRLARGLGSHGPRPSVLRLRGARALPSPRRRRRARTGRAPRRRVARRALARDLPGAAPAGRGALRSDVPDPRLRRLGFFAHETTAARLQDAGPRAARRLSVPAGTRSTSAATRVGWRNVLVPLASC